MPSRLPVYFTPVRWSLQAVRVGRQPIAFPLSELVLHLVYYLEPSHWVSAVCQVLDCACGQVAPCGGYEQTIWNHTTWI